MLIDSHAHIHFDDYSNDLEQVLINAKDNGISTIITVGTDLEDSKKATNFVLDPTVIAKASGIKLYSTVGVHPHEASLGKKAFLGIERLAKDSKYQKAIVAIGECGLDYFKNHSTKREQYDMLEMQLKLALDCGLPVVFHVRDAWEDFFSIIKGYPNTKGVIHSFTGHINEIYKANEIGLFFGLNGIMTFSKDQDQLIAAKTISQNRILLETDCPFLSPMPYRGKRNEPSYLEATAKFLAKLRSEDFTAFVEQTSKNTKELFSI